MLFGDEIIDGKFSKIECYQVKRCYKFMNFEQSLKILTNFKNIQFVKDLKFQSHKSINIVLLQNRIITVTF